MGRVVEGRAAVLARLRSRFSRLERIAAQAQRGPRAEPDRVESDPGRPSSSTCPEDAPTLPERCEQGQTQPH